MSEAATQTVWMPTDPPRPAPFVMTAEEVAVLLRLDREGVKEPGRTVLDSYYRAGLLRGRRLGQSVRFRLPDVLDFIEKHMEGK